MRRLEVLLVGGSGLISGAIASLAIELGHRVVCLTRGRSARELPAGAEARSGDIHDPEQAAQALGSEHFDVAMSFVTYTGADAEAEIAVLAPRADHIVFMSTCSVYERPAATLPISESFPRSSPRFAYPAGKIEAEDVISRLAPSLRVPITVLRASHVYDLHTLPVLAGWTAVERFRRGEPVVVHGDGTSLWNLLHAEDFAAAAVALLGHPGAFGTTVQIASPWPVSWDRVHQELARAAGVPDPRLLHVSSEDIGRELGWWGEVCREDFGHTVVYDLALLESLVPQWHPRHDLASDLQESVARFDAHPEQRGSDPEMNTAMNHLCAGRTA